MPFNNIGEPFKPLHFGNINGVLDAYVGNGIIDYDGAERKSIYALAKLTDTPQSAIPLLIPSWKREQTLYPDRPLVIPAGVTINRVSIRLAEFGNLFEGTSPYGLLPQGCRMLGTAGENIKVSPASGGTTHSTTAPMLTCGANGQYTPDSFSTVWRRSGIADQPAPSWITTTTAPVTPQVTISNAANTAPGNGINLSVKNAIAFIICWFDLEIDATPRRIREIELPIPPC